MNAKAIVDILLEGGAEDFVSSLPKGTLTTYYEFSQHPLRTRLFEVKRWKDGSYHYIGSVARTIDNLWYATEIAPNWSIGANKTAKRETREEAAEDLWELYKQANSKYRNESEADEFISGLPPETWDTFHIVPSGYSGIHGSDNREVVYKNNEDGTRDFIGYIQAMKSHWYITGVARPVRGQSTRIHSLAPCPPGHESKQEAAVELMRVYRQLNQRED